MVKSYQFCSFIPGFSMMLGQYIKNQRILAVLLLGFSSGLPLALTGSTLQAWFTQSNVNLVTIGTLSLLGLPYLWKFVWAPLLDRYLPPVLSRRGGWIFITQLLLCISFFIMAELNPANTPAWIGIIALCVAFLSATQDVGIDAYRTDILRTDERGLGAAVYTFSYRIALLVAGGLALIIADHWGWRVVYQMMALFMGMSAVFTCFMPKEDTPQLSSTSFWQIFKESFKDLLQRENIVWILLFVLLYKLGDALALSLMSNFLLKGLGFSLTDIGITYKIFGLIATLAGGFIAGALLTRVSLFQSLLWFGLAQAFSNLMFLFLAAIGKNYILMVSSIFIESFCSGMSTAAFIVFVMSLCNKRYTAGQYATLSALFSLGRVIAGPVAARFVENYGWINFYEFSFILCFPGILLLIALRNQVSMGHATPAI
jgi:PAT family beta-lactamase induction signal transducer AmpG